MCTYIHEFIIIWMFDDLLFMLWKALLLVVLMVNKQYKSSSQGNILWTIFVRLCSLSLFLVYLFYFIRKNVFNICKYWAKFCLIFELLFNFTLKCDKLWTQICWPTSMMVRQFKLKINLKFIILMSVTCR